MRGRWWAFSFYVAAGIVSTLIVLVILALAGINP